MVGLTQTCLSADFSYRSFYSHFYHPIVAERGQPVYVELSVVKREDRDFVLLPEDSWATPTEDSDGQQRWKLLLVTATKQLCCKFPIQN